MILYMFRALYAHHQEAELYDAASGIVTLSKLLSGAQVERKLHTASGIRHTGSVAAC